MKVSQVFRTVTATNTVWAAGDWTVTTDVAHYLGVGDSFSFFESGNSGNLVTVTTIAGTTGTTIKFTAAASLLIPRKINLNQYGTGLAASDIFTSSFSDGINGLVHIVSLGTATATAKVQGSLDKVHWVDHGTATAITAGSQLEVPITKPYPFLKVVFTVVPATASGGGNTNTIKVYKAGV